jgi:hypothetical protein
MTQEQFDLLTEYKEHLHTALYSDYSRYVPRKVIQQMVEIVRGKDSNYRMNANCPRCILSILKDVARIYEAEVERRKNVGYGEEKRKGRKSKTKTIQ